MRVTIRLPRLGIRNRLRAWTGNLRSTARVALVAVIAIDAVAVVAIAASVLSGSGAAVAMESVEAVGAEAQDPRRWSVEAVGTLGEELARRAEELERREHELQEILRGGEVLLRAGIAPDPPLPPAPAESGEPEPPQRKSPAQNPAFQRLQKAYENMEPESAATALSVLAERDKQAVVELLLGWPPRTSGAILDALTQVKPAIAADLSYEIWKRSEAGP